MSKIVDWEYYNSLYDNIADKAQFERISIKAEKEVCLVIGPIRWATITEDTFGYEQLQNCICDVINKLVETDKLGIGKGIASVTNDGYSENYVVQTESQAKAELQSCIKALLSGTGLVGAY